LYIYNVNKQIRNNNLVLNWKTIKIKGNIAFTNIKYILQLGTVHFGNISQLI
jgi:hypothetical protein